jgi:uncharacterized damage-inducible protein DinB
MAEYPLEAALRTALWQQFGAAIDMLENALVACPDTLWQEHLWIVSKGSDYGTFADITGHTLYWLDLYLTGRPEAEFTPPAPFKKRSDDVIPRQPYTRDELHTYLKYLRKKCQSTITLLSDEQGRQPFYFPWDKDHPISYFELQLYTMRHVQEHAAQLSLFLGQHGIPDEALDWVERAKDEAGRL